MQGKRPKNNYNPPVLGLTLEYEKRTKSIEEKIIIPIKSKMLKQTFVFQANILIVSSGMRPLFF